MARFIRTKSDSTVHSWRGRKWAGYRAAAALTQGKKLQRQTDSSLPLLAAPMVASLVGTLKSLEEKKAKCTCPRERRAWALSKESTHWVICLALASIYFLGFREKKAYFHTIQSLCWLFPGLALGSPPSQSLFSRFPQASALPLLQWPS